MFVDSILSSQNSRLNAYAQVIESTRRSSTATTIFECIKGRIFNEKTQREYEIKAWQGHARVRAVLTADEKPKKKFIWVGAEFSSRIASVNAEADAFIQRLAPIRAAIQAYEEFKFSMSATNWMCIEKSNNKIYFRRHNDGDFSAYAIPIDMKRWVKRARGTYKIFYDNPVSPYKILKRTKEGKKYPSFGQLHKNQRQMATELKSFRIGLKMEWVEKDIAIAKFAGPVYAEAYRSTKHENLPKLSDFSQLSSDLCIVHECIGAVVTDIKLGNICIDPKTGRFNMIDLDNMTSKRPKAWLSYPTFTRYCCSSTLCKAIERDIAASVNPTADDRDTVIARAGDALQVNDELALLIAIIQATIGTAYSKRIEMHNGRCLSGLLRTADCELKKKIECWIHSHVKETYQSQVILLLSDAYAFFTTHRWQMKNYTHLHDMLHFPATSKTSTDNRRGLTKLEEKSSVDASDPAQSVNSKT